MYRTYFDRRRPLLPVAGLPRELAGMPVRDPKLGALLSDPKGRARLLEDPVPIPHKDDREGYYDEHHLDYWASGYDDFLKLAPLFETAPAPVTYLDFGGATGRVLRHVRQEAGVDPWLVDINVNSIDWIRQHFPAGTKAFQGRVFPALPFEDRTFSVISAFSVFTHLDTDEIPWLLELRRILKPGGYLYLTTLDENAWDVLKKPEWTWLRESIFRNHTNNEYEALICEPMPGQRYVWTYSDADSYNVNTFLRSDYVKTVWGAYLELIDFRPWAHNFQSVVVLRKPG